jgi:hypothetical protein
MKYVTKVLYCAVLPWLLVGCVRERQICVKVIDSQTGRPLAGVSTVLRQERSDLFRGPAHIEPTNLPESKQDGSIRIAGVRKGTWNSKLVLSRAGYRKIYGYLTDQGLNWALEANEDDITFSVLEGYIRSAAVTNGCFIVPMTADSSK